MAFSSSSGHFATDRLLHSQTIVAEARVSNFDPAKEILIRFLQNYFYEHGIERDTYGNT